MIHLMYDHALSLFFFFFLSLPIGMERGKGEKKGPSFHLFFANVLLANDQLD